MKSQFSSYPDSIIFRRWNLELSWLSNEMMEVLVSYESTYTNNILWSTQYSLKWLQLQMKTHNFQSNCRTSKYAPYSWCLNSSFTCNFKRSLGVIYSSLLTMMLPPQIPQNIAAQYPMSVFRLILYFNIWKWGSSVSISLCAASSAFSLLFSVSFVLTNYISIFL